MTPDPVANQFSLVGTQAETYVPRRKTGRCSDGFERGGGRRYHAVRRETGRSLCGSVPGRLSHWSDESGDLVTCPACIKKLTKAIPPRSPTQQSWDRMKQRCNDPKHVAYARYGGRGIKVCERWGDSFEAFLADMGERPSKAHSLDRIDTDGNYDPGNCRWATPQQQQRNRRNVPKLQAFGRAQTLTDWAEEYGVNKRALRSRLVRGWSLERALMEPLR